MKVTQMNGAFHPKGMKAAEYTDDQMKQDLDFMKAEKITKKLLSAGLITEEEFDKIMAENRKTFSPFLADIL